MTFAEQIETFGRTIVNIKREILMGAIACGEGQPKINYIGYATSMLSDVQQMLVDDDYARTYENNKEFQTVINRMINTAKYVISQPFQDEFENEPKHRYNL